jgi:hypothetical protein
MDAVAAATAAGPGAGIRFNARRVDGAGDRVTEFDFGIVDAVAAENRATGFAHFLETAEQNLFENFRVALAGKRDNRECGDRRTAHRVDIAQRIGGGDGAEGKRVVDNRREKIDGLHERKLVRQTIHSGVVGSIEADQNIRIGNARQSPQHPVQ